MISGWVFRCRASMMYLMATSWYVCNIALHNIALQVLYVSSYSKQFILTQYYRFSVIYVAFIANFSLIYICIFNNIFTPTVSYAT